jgi:hypothetical protein
MKTRALDYCFLVVAVVGLLSLFLPAPIAQNAAPAAKAVPTPRLADGHPDFSGFYGGRHGDETRGALSSTLDRAEGGSIYFDYGGANDGASYPALRENPNQPAYKPEYMAKVNALADSMYGGNSNLDPQLDCKPNGVPRAGMGDYIVHTPAAVAILYEENPGPYWRLIYTDGRQHPKDLDTSYFGHSIGHWEGDTLVVDTVALNDETWLAQAQDGSVKHSTLHSDKLHVVERISRSGDTLTYAVTVEDPIMFTKPWVLAPRTRTINRSGDYIQPQMCVGLSKGHLVSPSPADPGLKCGWCVSESLYGGDSNLPTASNRQDEFKKLQDAGKVTGAPGAK